MDDDELIVAIQGRRRVTLAALLKEFERRIQPLIPPGHDDVISAYKGVVRQKVNGLAYEGIRALKAQPGDALGSLSTDLAGDLAFDEPED